jgi:hypothetical protein
MLKILIAAALLLIALPAAAGDSYWCDKKYRYGSPEWWECMSDPAGG